jgi:hypothetical protein
VKRLGYLIVAVMAAGALAAPLLAPNPPDRRFEDLLFAPPTRVHLFQQGRLAPHIYPWRLESRLERRFVPVFDRPSRLRGDRAGCWSRRAPTRRRRSSCWALMAMVAMSSRVSCMERA